MRLCSGILLLCFAVPAFAEPATKLAWTKRFGGSDYDQVRAMTTDAQGNIYVAGTTTSMDLPANGVFPSPPGTNLYRLTTSSSDVQPLRSSAGGMVKAIGLGPASSGVAYVATVSGLVRTGDNGNTWQPLQAPKGAAVLSLAVDPRDPGVVYAATFGSGLFKTTDAGQNWTELSSLALTTVVLDPVSPQTVYAAGFLNPSPAGYRSDDGGQTWVSLNAAVAEISVDASSPGTVYAAGNGPLQRSTDRGVTWVKLDRPMGCLSGTPQSDPVLKPNLYMNCSDAIYRSRDQGNTWHQLPAPALEVDLFVSLAPDSSLPLLYLTTLNGHVFRSADGGDTWTRTADINASQFTTAAAGGTLYVGTGRDTDGFAAKFTVDGELVWSTYVGGASDDSAGAIAVDASGNVYVAGTTSSADFPVTPGAYAGGARSTNAAFVTKISPDGARLVYSARLTLQGDVNSLAVDQEGSAYITGFTHEAIATTPGVVWPDTGTIPACVVELPNGCGDHPGAPGPSRAFLTKLTPSGSTLAYSTYLGDWPQGQGSAVAVDHQGNAYVAGSTLWKLSPDANQLLFATVLSGYGFQAAALDKNENLIVGGWSGAYLYTTPGVWKPWADMYDGFLAKYNSRGDLLASTSMGAGVSSVAVASDGSVIAGGWINGGSYYTKSILMGPLGPNWFARVSADFSQLQFSSFISGALVAGLPGNALLAAGSVPPANPIEESPSADVFLYRAEPIETDAPRIDSISNEADLSQGPLSPSERIIISGASFGSSGARVTIGGIDAEVVNQQLWALTVVVPNSIEPGKPADVIVETQSGLSSAPVPMPVVVATPTLYVSGPDSQALAFNEDGTSNSSTNPAAQGSILSFAINGIGQYSFSGNSIVPAQPLHVFILPAEADGLDANLLPAPGLKGLVPFVKVRVPQLSGLPPGATTAPLAVKVGQDIVSDFSEIWVK